MLQIKKNFAVVRILRERFFHPKTGTNTLKGSYSEAVSTMYVLPMKD